MTIGPPTAPYWRIADRDTSHNLDAGIRMVFKGFNHTKTPMPRFAPRVMTASLLAFVATGGRPDCLVRARPGGRTPGRLFDRIFSGSERFGGGGGERAAVLGRPHGADVRLRPRAAARAARDPDQAAHRRDRAAAVPQSAARAAAAAHAGGHRFPLPGWAAGRAPARRATASAEPAAAPSAPARRRAPGRRGDAFDPDAESERARRAAHAGLGRPAGARHRMSSPMSPTVAADEPVGAPVGARRAPRSISRPWGRRAAHRPVTAQSECRRRGGRDAAAVADAADEFDLAYGYVLRKDYALPRKAFAAS